MSKFELGHLCVTNGVSAKAEKDSSFMKFVDESFARYVKCDWGDTCEEDKIGNDYAVENEERVLAVYIYPEDGTNIWIITEWDRSVTTILFPKEY